MIQHDVGCPAVEVRKRFRRTQSTTRVVGVTRLSGHGRAHTLADVAGARPTPGSGRPAPWLGSKRHARAARRGSCRWVTREWRMRSQAAPLPFHRELGSAHGSWKMTAPRPAQAQQMLLSGRARPLMLQQLLPPTSGSTQPLQQAPEPGALPVFDRSLTPAWSTPRPPNKRRRDDICLLHYTTKNQIIYEEVVGYERGLQPN